MAPERVACPLIWKPKLTPSTRIAVCAPQPTPDLAGTWRNHFALGHPDPVRAVGVHLSRTPCAQVSLGHVLEAACPDEAESASDGNWRYRLSGFQEPDPFPEWALRYSCGRALFLDHGATLSLLVEAWFFSISVVLSKLKAPRS